MKKWKSELDDLIRDTMAFAAAAQAAVSASPSAVVQTLELSKQPSTTAVAPISPPHRDTLPNPGTSPEREKTEGA